MAGINFAQILSLNGKLNPETTKLFMTFVYEAMRSGNPDEYVRTALMKVLDVTSGEAPKGP